MLPGDKLHVRAVLLNHCQLQLWYLKGFYIFKSRYFTQRKQFVESKG